MKDDLIKIYEQMYGDKNTIEQVEQAIQTDLRGSETSNVTVIEAYSKADGYPKNEPAKAQSATEHVPDEVKPAIEAPKELSPAVDSSTSKQKLTKTITDKEKKQMTSHKFSFDELYKMALKEQVEGMPGPGLEDEIEGGEEVEAEGEIGGDEITVTISREAAQALHKVLMAALEGSEEEAGEEVESEEKSEEGEDLEEATEMSKLANAKSGAHDAKNQKVQDAASANAYIGEFEKTEQKSHAKVHKPKEDKAHSNR